MVLSIPGTSTLKPPKKRPFENHVHHQYQSFPPKFRRPKVDAVRDWPRLCGKFTPPTDSNVIGDNIAFGTAGNLQAPVANGIQGSPSTIDAEVTRDKVPRSYPPCKVLKNYPVVRDFPAGFKSASSSTNKNSASEKFNAEPRPLEIIETCPKSLGREMRGGRAFNGALERSSYEESNEVKRKIGGEVGETSGAVGEWVGDAKEVCILLGQEIQVGDSFQSALERSSCKETGNEIQNNFGGDVAETYKVEVKCGVDAKKMCTSLGQVKQGGGTCNRALKRSPWEATINEFWDKFGDVGETSGLLVRQGGDTKEIGMHPQLERNLLQLDPWCQTFGNKAGRGKSVLRSIGKEVEICSKDQSSMDHQTIVNNSRVQGALNLFQELLEKLTHEASLTMKKVIISKLHVEAAMTLKRQQKWVNTTKRLGHVPGIEVGDTFRYRVELCIIGLHSHFQNGIDYMEKDGKILAISIVDSGRYANDKESSDILIYSGQGGNPMVGHKQAEDQKLERGNLALKNSMDAKTPVRVTRGFQATKGKEERPIRVVNTIDDEKPQPFSYIARMVYLESSNWSIPSGCDCTDGCSDSVKCACVLKNGGEIPFNCSGAIIEAKPWIYECGPLCKCPPSCNNRVSQNGIRFPLEVFKTKSTGWGVRSRNYIPSGSFICEYAGELIQDKEAEQRVGNDEYLFDLGGGMNCLESQLNSFEAMDDLQSSSYKAKDYGAFAIDAAKFANVGRFFNHSCSPNLYAQNVLYDHDDKRMPHIMLFATKNIPPMRELTYDYNYMVGQVRDINGKIKKKRCYCGSRECTGRMY
ncbi:Histone-lysine N-methyltransferase, H3 lysine-9 specific SUVH5 [Vitis vinifera]|uniref:Histone-lysine N-methyltransferase, H3 lysine-9 specific SUVH5 n=1 Tax=Vitis vinifera TaxID=29760 RepID=A0A438BQX7_VITVI|nr:Histone-lysine N-methyltransferase, H3 lysine-9 specific SUVH5 [Vitis vinifera]